MILIFQEIIKIGCDLLMPVKKITKNTADAPWMTQNLKSLILKRQRVFTKYGGNSSIFKFFRNAVNRDRKVCKSRYYESRVQAQMKGKNPKGWWREVKRLSGMQSHTRDLLSQLNVPEIESLSLHGKANAINAALLEPLSEYQRNCPLNKLPLEECPRFLQISEDRVLSLLVKLNSTKASGPDGI